MGGAECGKGGDEYPINHNASGKQHGTTGKTRITALAEVGSHIGSVAHGVTWEL